jgi:hypothetical protein
MEKKHIVKFLNSRKRGVYNLLVEIYADVVSSMAMNIALEIINDDLEREAGEKTNLNYSSFAKAVTRFKKKCKPKLKPESRKKEFKDAHELSDKPPGTFTCGNEGQPMASMSNQGQSQSSNGK